MSEEAGLLEYFKEESGLKDITVRKLYDTDYIISGKIPNKWVCNIFLTPALSEKYLLYNIAVYKMRQFFMINLGRSDVEIHLQKKVVV